MIRSMNFLILILVLLSVIFSLDAETLLLRDGRKIKGRVLSQIFTSVTFKIEGGATEEFPKKQILKVIFKEVSAEEAEKELQEELKKDKEKQLAKQKKEKEEREKLLEEMRLKKIEEEKEKLVKSKPFEKPKNSSTYFYSPNSKTISLASTTAECSVLKEVKQWYVLFGSVPVNTVNTDEMFLENGQYRIFTKATLSDSILSVILGLTTSLTRKTVFVEKCSSDSVIILQKNELEALLNKHKESAGEELIQEMEEDNEKFKK